MGVCPQTGKPVYLKVGRFGPYVQRGNTDDEEKPQNASLVKGMRPEDVDLDTAVKLLSLPRRLGRIRRPPSRWKPITAAMAPTSSRAMKPGHCRREFHLWMSRLSKPWPCWPNPRPDVATAGQGQGAAEGLHGFAGYGAASPLREGGYGPYVTDGQTNASLPKSMSPEELTLPAALDLLKS